MNKTVYLHIGMHKTGTSSLQALFACNPDWLTDQGVLYPMTGRPDSSSHGQHELVWAITGKRNAAASVWAQLTTELEMSQLDRTLVSAEGFSSMSEEQVAVVRKLLNGFSVEVIAYVRDPFDFLVSAYGQQITSQTAYSGSFDEFVHNNLHRCDYEALAQKWAYAFGDAAVRMRSFDHAKSIGLARDFCNATAISFSDAAPIEPAVHNPGKGSEDLSWFRVLNRLEARLPGGRAMRPAFRKLRRLSRFGFGNANAFRDEITSLEASIVERTKSAVITFASKRLPADHQKSFLRRY